MDNTFNPGARRGGQDGEEDEDPYDGPGIPSPVRFPDGVPDNIDDMIGGIQRERKTWKESRSGKPKIEEPSGVRAVRQQEVKDRAFCAQYEVSYEDMRRFKKVEASIRPYLAQLETLWKRIIYGQSRERVVDSVGHYREGEELDVTEAIHQFPEIVSGGTSDARVMRRSETVRERVRRPELIRVRLLGDCSGSMDMPREYREGVDAGFVKGTISDANGSAREVKFALDKDGKLIRERRDVLEQVFVLLMVSLRQFQAYLNMSRGTTQSNLVVDTEAWMYGEDTKKVKAFRGKYGQYEREYADMIRAFAQLRGNLGGTRDDKPLAEINTSISSREAEQIRTKKTMEIVFEITDGGTNLEGVGLAKEALAKLDAKGVIARAFQIGTTDPSEQATFQDVWNTDASGEILREPRGHIVGAEIKNLLPAITSALEKYLSRVEL